MPPVTVMVSPVIYDASSEHKNAITPPMSSGSPSLKYEGMNISGGVQKVILNNC